MRIIRVLLPKYRLFPLDYIDNSLCNIGDIVHVPFKKEILQGIVWEVDIDSNIKQLKHIIDKTTYQISKDLITLIKKTSEYYMSDLGSVAKMVLPVALKEETSSVQIKSNLTTSLPKLFKEQQEALNTIEQYGNSTTLLHGVTGSGKTEVYFHLIYNKLKENKQVLVLIPEIALTNQIISRFIERFGFTPAIWHSSVTKSKKQEILTGIIKNEIKIIVGVRSSLYLPYVNLGLIVVDEEHDTSYKQDDLVLYNARDMAVLKGNILNIPIVLSTASPAIETYNNVKNKKYNYISLPSRYGQSIMTKIEIVDVSKLPKGKWIDARLKAAISNTLNNKEQVLLFLNRKGYAPAILCKLCSFKFACDNCSTLLVFHKVQNKLLCHYCGYKKLLVKKCPSCEEEGGLIACGPGIERIAEEIQKDFGDFRIEIVSKDTMKPKMIREILRKIENYETDIIIGTQIITKGYHFPKLNLVGVVDADLGLHGADLRSAERTFQLLYQVSGRAGRESGKSSVYIQTYQPNSLVINAIKNGRMEEFMEYELTQRQKSQMPPFAKFCSIILSCSKEELVMDVSKQLVNSAPVIKDIKILGPSPNVIFKIKNKYRVRIIFISPKAFNLQKYISTVLLSVKIPSSIFIKIDIDPYDFS